MKRHLRRVVRPVSHLGAFDPKTELHPLDKLDAFPGLVQMGYGHLIAKKAVETPKGG